MIVETRDFAGDHSGQVTDIGIIVDAVNEVVGITEDMIEPTPTFGAAIRPEFINGIAKQDGQFIVMLELNTVLSVNVLATLEKTSLGNNESQLANLPHHDN